jgi:hypothetical protein
MPFLHCARDMVITDQAKTMLQEEPLKDGCSRGDNGCSGKAVREQESEI